MKRYMLLHVGFETPTADLMARWKAWFEAVASNTVENVGLRAAREITKEGAKDLPWGKDSLTGYTIVNAADLDAAEALARTNPFVTSVRIYELTG